MAFAQFLWGKNIVNFEKVCKKIKAEQPNKPKFDIEEVVKSKFLSYFSQLTPEARKQLVNESRVLIFP